MKTDLTKIETSKLQTVHLPEVPRRLAESVRKTNNDIQIELPAAALESSNQWIVKYGENDYVRIRLDKGKWSAERGDYRHFDTSSLPTLRPREDSCLPSNSEPVSAVPVSESAVADADQQVLSLVYSEVVATWHKLGDTRFTLIGLLPAVSIVAWVQLFSSDYLRGMPGSAIAASLGVLALIAVTGIWIYNKRNDELYDDIISRGRKIEEELGLYAGLFIGRRRPQRRGRNHSIAVGLIYFATTAGWIFVILVFVMISISTW